MCYSLVRSVAVRRSVQLLCSFVSDKKLQYREETRVEGMQIFVSLIIYHILSYIIQINRIRQSEVTGMSEYSAISRSKRK